MSSRRPNCSAYNPCGRNGYCEDDFFYQWTCSCKFWWSGSTCDHLTDSGVQVIILGCLLGILVGTYYGMIIRRLIIKRREKIKTNTNERQKKFSLNIDLKIYRTTLIFSAIILIMAIVALLVKWSMIQTIHNQIVDRYRHNLSLHFDANSICHIIDKQKINLIMFPISCVIIVIFTIEYKRHSFMIDSCNGHIAPPMPVDFFSNQNRTFVAVTFAMSAHELLVIANNALNGSLSTDNGVVLAYLQQIFQVLVMGFRYYPILSAVHLDSLSSLALGTIYIYLEFPMVIVEQSMCQPKFYSSENITDYSVSNTLIEFYGTGSLLVVIELLVDIPRYLCLSYITVRLSQKLFIKFRDRSIRVEKENELWRVVEPDSIEMRYLRNLFERKKTKTSKHWMYQWRRDFRYSTRVLSVYSSLFLFLYVLLIQGLTLLLPVTVSLQEELQALLDAFDVTTSISPNALFVIPFLLSGIFGTMTVVIQLLFLLASIRRNLLQVYCGDDSEIPRRQRSQYVSYAIGNFHFAGYLIGYVLWGLVLIIFSFFIVFLIISGLIVFHAIGLIELILKYLIPVLLFVYFKKYLNRILARFAFLQDDGEVLAVNNRRLLMIFLYFNFYLDAFLGLFSSILRLVQSLIGGVLYMCRLDYSPLGRKLETLDDGFGAYCGFIHTECTHRHPILLIFVGHLLSQNRKRNNTVLSIMNQLAVGDVLPMRNHTEGNPRRKIQIIRKWQLTTFLIRNPSIVFFRKAYFNQFHMVEHRTMVHRQTSALP